MPNWMKEKTLNRCQHWDDKNVRIINKKFKATITRMSQWTIMNILETKEKIENFSKSIESLSK